MQMHAMYDERMLNPMRQELTRLGIEELRTPDDVDLKLANTPGTALVVVNSVCGCAARNARPAVALALQHMTKPDHLTTVFAGQDIDATNRARGMFTGVCAEFAEHCVAQGREVGAHDRAVADRGAARRGDLGGPDGGVRQALRIRGGDDDGVVGRRSSARTRGVAAGSPAWGSSAPYCKERCTPAT